MSPEELAEIEARLKAARGDDGTLALTADEYGHVWYADGDACVYVRGSLGLGIDGSELARLLAHAPTDIAALLAEVRRLTPPPKVATWGPGIYNGSHTHAGKRVLRAASGRVLATVANNGYTTCSGWSFIPSGDPDRAVAMVTAEAKRRGWEVRDA